MKRDPSKVLKDRFTDEMLEGFKKDCRNGVSPTEWYSTACALAGMTITAEIYEYRHDEIEYYNMWEQLIAEGWFYWFQKGGVREQISDARRARISAQGGL